MDVECPGIATIAWNCGRGNSLWGCNNTLTPRVLFEFSNCDGRKENACMLTKDSLIIIASVCDIFGYQGYTIYNTKLVLCA